MHNRIRFNLSSGLMGISLAAPLIVDHDSKATPRTTMEIMDQGQGESDKAVYEVPLIQQVESNAIVFNITENNPEWEKSDEKSFLELARKEALGTASAEDLQNLEKASKKRDRLRNRLSLDEILFRKRQTQLETLLVATLQEYFKFGRPNARPSYQIKS